MIIAFQVILLIIIPVSFISIFADHDAKEHPEISNLILISEALLTGCFFNTRKRRCGVDVNDKLDRNTKRMGNE